MDRERLQDVIHSETRPEAQSHRKEAAGPNNVWAMPVLACVYWQTPRGGFVHDQLATSHKLHIPTMGNTHSRYCLVSDARFTSRGQNAVQPP